jgi:DNA-binding beta-propeller fold protein YncE
MVYVTDEDNHRIQVFDANGTYLTAFGNHGGGLGSFNVPRGVAVDKDLSIVYVADRFNHRIQVFGAAVLQDSDRDGIPDREDNCFEIFNPNQEDNNYNGIGDACETITDLTARSKSGKVSLVWTPVPEAENYTIYRSINRGGPYHIIAEGHVTDYATYLDVEVVNGTTYYYVVRWNEELPYSNEASAKPTERSRR